MKRFRSVCVVLYVFCVLGGSWAQEERSEELGSGQPERIKFARDSAEEDGSGGHEARFPAEEPPKLLGPERKRVEIRLGSSEVAAGIGIAHVQLHEVAESAKDALGRREEVPSTEEAATEAPAAEDVPRPRAAALVHIREHPDPHPSSEEGSSGEGSGSGEDDSQSTTPADAEDEEVPDPPRNNTANDAKTIPIDIEALKVMAETVYDFLNHTQEKNAANASEETDLNPEDAKNLDSSDNSGRFKKDLKANNEENERESNSSIPQANLQAKNATEDAPASDEEDQKRKNASAPLEGGKQNASSAQAENKTVEESLETEDESSERTDSPRMLKINDDEEPKGEEEEKEEDGVEPDAKKQSKSSSNNLQHNFMYLSTFLPVIFYYCL